MKKLLNLAIVAWLTIASCVHAQSQVNVEQLLAGVTATGAGSAKNPYCTDRTFHAYGATSAGAGSATVVIEASDKDTPATATRVDWVTLGTITLTLSTTQTGDGFASQARWRHVRANVTAISGTGANVSAWIGC